MTKIDKPIAPSTQMTLLQWVSKRGWWLVGIVIIVAALLWILRPVMAILAASIGISYLLVPYTNWLKSKGFSKDISVGIVFSVVLSLFFGFCMLIVPPVILQLDTLSEDFSVLIHTIEDQIIPATLWFESVSGYTIPVDFEGIKVVAPRLASTYAPQIQSYLSKISHGLFTQGLGLLNTILNITLLPIFVFYLLRDWDLLLKKILSFIPSRHHNGLTETLTEVDERLSAFVRGQIKVCIYLAVLYTVGLLIVGIDLAIPIGILSGTLFIIPYLGTVVGIILGVFMAILKFGFSWHVLGVFGVFAVSQSIEGWFLTPYIVGDKVGLSPMVVMIALIVGGSILGIWGMMLAIPITAVLSVIGSRWIQAYIKSDFYTK